MWPLPQLSERLKPPRRKLATRMQSNGCDCSAKAMGEALSTVSAEIAKPEARGTPSSGLWLLVFLESMWRGRLARAVRDLRKRALRIVRQSTPPQLRSPQPVRPQPQSHPDS